MGKKMSFFLAALLFALIGCAGNKAVEKSAVVEQSVDNRCKQLSEIHKDFIEDLKDLNEKILNDDGKTYCEPHETIICDGIEYLYSHICPDGQIVTWFGKDQ
jgi:hypothetical protein